jgi:hypothetical protein
MPIPPYMWLKDDGGAIRKDLLMFRSEKVASKPAYHHPPHPLNTSRRCHATNPSCG